MYVRGWVGRGLGKEFQKETPTVLICLDLYIHIYVYPSMKNRPVEMPQAKRQALSKGAEGLILATQPASTTVYSLKLETLRK